MPVRFEIDAEREVVFVFYSGVVILEEVRFFVEGVSRDPRFRPHFSVLIDCSQVVSFEMEHAEVAASVDIYHATAYGTGTGRVACYTRHRDSVYGVVRAFQAMSGHESRIQIYTDLAEARAWVGLPPT